MSRTVKIPECANPFEVIVNSVKHCYPAGETVEVPDEVADIIESHNKKHEPVEHKHEPPFSGGGPGGSGGGGAQSDWGANTGESGHVLNRTHYAEKVVSTFVDEILAGFDPNTGAFQYKKPFRVYAGEEYTVSWEGTEYKCICTEFATEEITMLTLGNIGAVLGGESTGEPFVILTDLSEQGKQSISAKTTATIAPLDGAIHPDVKITGLTDAVHELAPKYIATEISAIKDYIDDRTVNPIAMPSVEINSEEHKEATISAEVCNLIARGFKVAQPVRYYGQDYILYPQFCAFDGGKAYRATVIFSDVNHLTEVGNVYCLTIHIDARADGDSFNMYYAAATLRSV